MTRVLLADDHIMMRAGLQRLIGDFDGFEIVGEAANGHETLQQIEKHRPNVVLLDLLMPGLNGLDATTRIRQSFPDVRVLILSMHSAEEYVLKALRNGAHGYLVKSDSPTELELALRAVASGETYLSSAVSKHVITGYVNRVSSDDSKISSLGRLTPRLRDVLRLVAQGNSTKQIAAKLELSPKTVETYRTQLMQALKINDVAGLVRYAVGKGLVATDS